MTALAGAAAPWLVGGAVSGFVLYLAVTRVGAWLQRKADDLWKDWPFGNE